MDSVDEGFDQGMDHEGEDNSGRDKNVEMEDRDTKRLKNTSDSKSSASKGYKEHSTSITKGSTLKISASDVVWVTPRASSKELTDVDQGNDATALSSPEHSLVSCNIPIF